MQDVDLWLIAGVVVVGLAGIIREVRRKRSRAMEAMESPEEAAPADEAATAIRCSCGTIALLRVVWDDGHGDNLCATCFKGIPAERRKRIVMKRNIPVD